MQVILLEKIGNLGNLGEVVKVKDGFARNYLIPQKKAKRATKQAMAEFEAARAELEAAQAAKLAAAQELAGKLNEFKLVLSQKAGVDGRLFGSVTNMDIATALQAQGFDVIRSQVRLDNGAFKHVGEFPVSLHLHADVNAEILLVIEGEMA